MLMSPDIGQNGVSIFLTEIMMMMNMLEIRFETSFIIDIFTVWDYVIYYFSSTQKCIQMVRNFMPIITLSVQHENVYQWYTFPC